MCLCYSQAPDVPEPVAVAKMEHSQELGDIVGLEDAAHHSAIVRNRDTGPTYLG